VGELKKGELRELKYRAEADTTKWPRNVMNIWISNDTEKEMKTSEDIAEYTQEILCVCKCLELYKNNKKPQLNVMVCAYNSR